MKVRVEIGREVQPSGTVYLSVTSGPLAAVQALHPQKLSGAPNTLPMVINVRMLRNLRPILLGLPPVWALPNILTALADMIGSQPA